MGSKQKQKIWVMWVWLSFCCSITAFGFQPEQGPISIKGTPRIIHYTKKDFQGDPQFWTMAQDRDGILYFGNNDGALIYDGEVWQKVTLPNNSSIRSLKVSTEGVVYAGGYNELGIIEKDDFGKYQYKSLIHLLRPEDQSLENIWQIHEVQGHMIFRSYRMLVAVANNKAVTIPTSSAYDFSTVVGEKLYVKDAEGLKVVNLTSLEIVPALQFPELNNESLLTLLPGSMPNEILALTKNGSFFKINELAKTIELWQQLLPPNSNNLLTCAIESEDGNYYIGTLRSKVISLAKSGKKIESNAAFNTIQDNTVLNLFETREGNIWVMLNNGIDCIDLSSPLSLLFENASVYDVLPQQNTLYLATNQGVFSTLIKDADHEISTANFTNISGLEGQAWSLQFFENTVLCSHDRGLFQITKDRTVRIPGVSGVWKVIEINNKSHHYLVCTYEGLYLMVYDSKTGFEIRHKLEGFQESSRDILQSDEPGIFWICHGYKGVFRIKIDEAYKRAVGLEHFKDQNGLPSPFNVNVFRWNNEIVFTTNAGIFQYNLTDNKFYPHSFLTALFGTDRNVRKLLQHGDRTWFAHDNEVGFFQTNAENPQLQKDLFLQLKGTFNPSMECIVPFDDQLVFLGTNTGLYAFDLNYNANIQTVPVLFSAIAYKQGQHKVNLNLQDAKAQRLPYETNSIEFRFSVPAFQDKLSIQYSYWLEGAEESWSSWQEGSYKEFSLLPPGHYAFHIKARSLLGEKSAEAVYEFYILPAWYQTPLAILFYCIAAIVLLVCMIYLVKRRINKEKEKTRVEEIEKRKVLELELERIKLSREKEEIKKDKDLLEEDVIYKSKELANYTMLLVKKRELLSTIHDELKELKETVRNDASRQIVRDLIKKVNTNLQNEEHLKVFEANFERVHHEFFSQLKSTFPDLTPKELQLCAFVRMNLTNKEIASILNISVRGVETARYRLRKRLGMTQEDDMGRFLEKLYSSHDASLEEHS